MLGILGVVLSLDDCALCGVLGFTAFTERCFVGWGESLVSNSSGYRRIVYRGRRGWTLGGPNSAALEAASRRIGSTLRLRLCGKRLPSAVLWRRSSLSFTVAKNPLVSW